MKKQTSLITLSLMLATPALAGGAGAPVAGGGTSTACRTIAQIVSTDPQFSTLLTAVQAAGLAETLASGQYTVFAPTNAAFAKLPSDQLAAVLNDPEMLRGVLLYHVVPGKVTSRQVASLRSVKTAQGANLTVSVMGSRVMINNANVTRADVAACNGVIHVIDTVLMPPMAAAAPAPAPAPAAAAPAPAAPEPAAPATTTDTTTTTDTAATAPAPAPTAPAAVDLTSIPALPVTGATVTSTGAATTTTTTDTSTAGTTTDTTATTDTSATTTDTAATTTETTTDTTAATTDTTATGTTATDTTTTEAAPATNTLYDVIVSDERFSTLRDLLSDAGLTEMLTSGEYTVFAPTNEAFSAISDDQLAALLDNPDLLRRILSYHVVQGRISAEQLASGTALTTAEGGTLTPMMNGTTQMVGQANISETVSTASNGTIYVIDRVLLPEGVTLPVPAATTDTATTTDATATTTTTDTTAATTTTTTDTAAAGTTATTTTPAAGTLVALLTSDPRFSTLAGLIQQAGLTETLSGGEYTVFAPTNDAFAKIPAADLAAITGDPARLRAVLLYHVVQGRQTAEQLAAATQLTTGQGGTVALNLNGTTQVVGGVNVSERLDTASNGTVYVIDTVLLPPNP